MLKIQGLRFKVVLCVSLFIIYFSLLTVSYAAHPLITDDTGTQGKGKFQLEINGGYGHNLDDGAITQTTQLSTILTCGLSDAVDVSASLPYEHSRTEASGEVTKGSGTGDMSLEAKWRFFEKEGFSFALKPGITFPTGNEENGLGSRGITYHLFLTGTKEIKPWAFHINLGFTRNENKADENKDLWHASFASTVEVMKDLKLADNIGLEKNTDRHLNVPNVFILGGVIYSISENFDVDLGIKGGLSRAEEDYALLAGVTVRF